MTLDKRPVPGNYDMTEVFGIEKQDLMDMIHTDTNPSIRKIKRN